MKKNLHFTIAELCRSNTAIKMGIDNTPTADVKMNLKRLIDNVLEPARELIDAPIFVNSGYRCPELNKIVGGVHNSQHCEGKAADITTRNPKLNKLLFSMIQDELDYDQLIWECGGLWIHVSYNNRKQVIR